MMMKMLRYGLLPCLLFVMAGCSGVEIDRTGFVKISPHTYAYIARGATTDEGLGANAGFVVGEQGVLVIDSRYTPALALELRDVIQSVTDAPIRYLVNTHYHPDHTWGNEVFKNEGALIIARPETRSALETYSPVYMEYYRERKPETFRKLKDINVVLPDSTFEDMLTIDLGGVTVVLEYFGPAHTAGDCIVTVPRDRVAFTGGILSNGYHPNLGDQGADFDNWLRILDRLDGMDLRYLVPGQGKVCRSNALDAQKGYVVTLRELCVQAIRRNISLDEAVGTITVPAAVDYLQPNILPFNVSAVFRQEVLDVVKPPFTLDLPSGFSVADGGGETKHGWVRWAAEGEDGLFEVEVQWNPSARTEVIVQDIHDRVAHYLALSTGYEMKAEGSRRIDVGGQEALAIYGRWLFKPKAAILAGGIWTWVMTARDGTLYSIKLSTNAQNVQAQEQKNMAALERIASTFSLSQD
ncbi:MAG: MBL fold metallo-hydrolase [bacterium]|nr:MAG: MBL fold metallo-hydrolase [bacterium]